ncbi:MAG: hypothetical protein K8R68_11320 [Bacteroidales bacterium]|nr:hypothetical protein [Bacteroidales bacterium]
MKKFIVLVLFVFAGFLFYTANAQDVKKESKIVEVVSAEIEAARGPSPHITTPKPTGDEVKAPKPEKNKGTRGDYCKVTVDNWTGYAIDIYVDGVWEGTVAAWSDGYTWAIEGKTKLYGESVGGTKYWGPTYVDCYVEHTWKLTD